MATTATVTPTTMASSSQESLAKTKTKTKTREVNDGSIPFKEAWSQWRHSPNQKDAEQAVFSHLNIVKSPRPGVKTALSNVTIQMPKTIVKSRKPVYLHQFSVEPESHDPTSNNNLVIMHGYAAGMGFFFKNFDGLHEGLPDWNIYSLDWLGFGLSARPKFSVSTSSLSELVDPTKEMDLENDKNPVKVARETEDWFVESLEAWRKVKNIEKFTLMGHSLGGYLSSVYAFRYPERVQKLILISPVGVERGYNESLNDRSFLSVFKSNKKASAHPPAEEEVLGVDEEMTDDAKAAAEVKSEFKRSQDLNKLLIYLWNHHISPFFILRGVGPLGPKFMSRWSHLRFKQFDEQERTDMHIYCYKTFLASPSGEYGLTRLLAPIALARMPLIDRVVSQLKCPSVWIYGDRDWMDSMAGVNTVSRLNKTGNPAQKANFHIVKDAGHHVYLDNYTDFNKLVLGYIGKEA